MKTPGKAIANLILNDLQGLLKKHSISVQDSPVKPEALGFLGRRVADGSLSSQQARKLLTRWFHEGAD